MAESIVQAVRSRWQNADLGTQFAITATAVIGCGMAVLGWWVSGRIERGVVAHAAASASLHMDVFIEPHLQDLATQQDLSAVSQRALRELVSVTDMGQSVVAVTIWGAGGRIIYSTQPEGLAATHWTNLPFVTKAWQGTVQNTLEPATAGAAGRSRQDMKPMLRVFAPMHVTDTAQVLAVAELDSISDALTDSLQRTRLKTTGMVGLMSIAMVASLFGIVRRASRTIREQREALEGRVGELSALLTQNVDLQSRLLDASRRVTDHGDRTIRRIGAELHDGPVQLIALGLLRLEALRLPGIQALPGKNHDDLDAIEGALRDALKEIRDLCSGLALPHLENVPVQKVIQFAVMNHERRTRSSVTVDVAGNLPVRAPPQLLTCVYRFVQEGLNNAVRHAGGKGQTVRANFTGDTLELDVSDSGPGITEAGPELVNASADGGLGLAGLRDRVETMGGKFTITSEAGQGTRISALFDLNKLEVSFSPFPGNVVQ